MGGQGRIEADPVGGQGRVETDLGFEAKERLNLTRGVRMKGWGRPR